MKRIFSAAVLGTVLILSGCGGETIQSGSAPETASAWKIGISFPTTDLIYRQKMLELLQQYDEQHPETEFVILDAENSREKQNRDILELLQMPADGVILIPYTMEAPLSVIHYANELGIPVLTLDNDVTRSHSARTIGYVGANHTRMGEQAAELLLESLQSRFPEEEQWNVIYLTGVADSSGAVDRNTGIQSVLNEHPEIQILDTCNGEFTAEKAKSILQDCLQVYPEIHGVICQNDMMAEGCYEALAEQGLEGKIALIGIDGQRSIIEKIEEGKIDGTVLESPGMAAEAAERMTLYLQGEVRSGDLYTDTFPVTAENAQEYLENGLAW